MTLHRKKAVSPNYLNEDNESLVVSSDDIKGGHGLLLDYRGVAHYFQDVVKSVNTWCGGYEIQEKSLLMYLCKVIKTVNTNEDYHKIQTRKLHTGLVNVYSLINNHVTQSDTSISWIIFY